MMRLRKPELGLLLLALFLLVGCATPSAPTGSPLYSGFDPRKPDRELARRLADAGLAKTFRKDPDAAARELHRKEAGTPQERLLLARTLIQAGVRHDRRGSEPEAAGRYLEAAGVAERLLESRPPAAVRDEALILYSTASRAFLRLWADLPEGTPPRTTWEVEGISGSQVVTRTSVPGRAWPADRFVELTPTDTVRRKKLKPRVVREGVGLTFVGEMRRRTGEMTPRRVDLPTTALLDPAEPSSPASHRVELVDPNRAETTAIGGGSLPVAADFTTPRDRDLLINKGIRMMEIMGVLNPAKVLKKEGIYVLEPFDPERIPVVFIHGLQSSSFAWLPMLNGLTADPEIRKRYQFWVYQYPSGLPIALASARCRAHLDKVHALYAKAGRADNADRMVLVGHSMGGLHSRMQIIDSGDAFYSTAFQIPLEQLPISRQARETIRLATFFKPRPYVSRVIFMSTPHRGSEIASGWIGKISIALIRIPGDLLGFTSEILTLRDQVPGILVKRPPTSIGGLSPESTFVEALNERPLPRHVPYHSVIGDRGKGNTPKSSDGVVPYWSSHVEGAASEKIVPSDHSSQQHPDGIAEVNRILREHLQATPARR